MSHLFFWFLFLPAGVEGGEEEREDEEEHHKKLERAKKMQRNQRKIELKKEAVVRKQKINEI